MAATNNQKSGNELTTTTTIINLIGFDPRRGRCILINENTTVCSQILDVLFIYKGMLICCLMTIIPAFLILLSHF